MNKSFTISGFTMQTVTVAPCTSFAQYMAEKPVTCQCAQCVVRNAGMSQQQIVARMDKANGR